MHTRIYNKTGITLSAWTKMSTADRIAMAVAVLGHTTAVSAYRAKWAR